MIFVTVGFRKGGGKCKKELIFEKSGAEWRNVGKNS